MLLQNNNSIVSSTKYYFSSVAQKKFVQCFAKKVHTETINELKSIAKECNIAFHDPVVTEIAEIFPFNNPDWKNFSPKEVLEPFLALKGGSLSETLSYESPYKMAQNIINYEWGFADTSKTLFLFLMDGVCRKADEAPNMGEVEKHRFDLVNNELSGLYNPDTKSRTVGILFNSIAHTFVIQTWLYRATENDLWGATTISYVILKLLLGDCEYRTEELKAFLILFRYVGVLSPTELYLFILNNSGNALGLMLGQGYFNSKILHYALGIMPTQATYVALREFTFLRENNFPHAFETLSKEEHLLFLTSVGQLSPEMGDLFLTSMQALLRQTPKLT